MLRTFFYAKIILNYALPRIPPPPPRPHGRSSDFKNNHNIGTYCNAHMMMPGGTLYVLYDRHTYTVYSVRVGKTRANK